MDGREDDHIVPNEKVILPVNSRKHRNIIQQPHDFVFPQYIFFAR